MSLSGHKPIARRVMQGASFSIRRMLPLLNASCHLTVHHRPFVPLYSLNPTLTKIIT
jgi:hypothetical protein